MGKETFIEIPITEDVKIPFKFHTPNQLWKDIKSSAKEKGILYDVLVDPGKKVNNSFLRGKFLPF